MRKNSNFKTVAALTVGLAAAFASACGEDVFREVKAREILIAMIDENLSRYVEELQSRPARTFAHESVNVSPSCLTLSNRAHFSAGRGYSTELMELMKAGSWIEEGQLMPREGRPWNYFTTTEGFWEEHSPSLLNLAHIDFPRDTFIGCSQDEAALRAMQKEINERIADAYLKHSKAKLTKEIEELRNPSPK